MIQIRSCQIDDFKGVLALLCQLWPNNLLDVDSVRLVYDRAIASNVQEYVCANDSDKIVGFASLTIKNSLWQEGFLGHVDEFIVDGAYRGRGIGTQLLDHIISLAKLKGCHRIELDTAFHRQDAHRFYEKHGFENRGYIFTKKLIQPPPNH
jgi:GNAT superfamily N-acetyltransferase